MRLVTSLCRRHSIAAAFLLTSGWACAESGSPAAEALAPIVAFHRLERPRAGYVDDIEPVRREALEHYRADIAGDLAPDDCRWASGARRGARRGVRAGGGRHQALGYILPP